MIQCITQYFMHVLHCNETLGVMHNNVVALMYNHRYTYLHKLFIKQRLLFMWTTVWLSPFAKSNLWFFRWRDLYSILKHIKVWMKFFQYNYWYLFTQVPSACMTCVCVLVGAKQLCLWDNYNFLLSDKNTSIFVS